MASDKLLTSPNLRAECPKLNRDSFVKDFVKSQSRHVKSFRDEGLLFSATWDARTAELDIHTKRTTAAKNDDALGFGTPVLQPRTTKVAPPNVEAYRSAVRTAHSQDECADDSGDSRKHSIREKESDHLPAPISVTHSSPPVTNKPPIHPRKKLRTTAHKDDTRAQPRNKPALLVRLQQNKTRGRELDSDEERDARLAERRERKKAKREIVNPKAAPAADSDFEEEENRARTTSKPGKNKSKQPKKPKASAGLALMHGFSATNVGKNRLTLQAPAIGVFTKGKASAKTEVADQRSKKAAPIHSNLFAEHDFLNKTRPPAKPVQDDAFLASDSESDASPDPHTPKPKARPPKNRKKRSHSTPPSPSPAKKSCLNAHSLSDDESAHKRTKAGSERKAAESEVWDIEVGLSLPSGSPKNTETVVLNTRAVAWAAKRAPSPMPVAERCAESVIPFERPGSPMDDVDAVHSSIAPSHSASQLGLCGRKAVENNAVSRFFSATGAANHTATETRSTVYRLPLSRRSSLPHEHSRPCSVPASDISLSGLRSPERLTRASLAVSPIAPPPHSGPSAQETTHVRADDDSLLDFEASSYPTFQHQALDDHFSQLELTGDTDDDFLAGRPIYGIREAVALPLATWAGESSSEAAEFTQQEPTRNSVAAPPADAMHYGGYDGDAWSDVSEDPEVARQAYASETDDDSVYACYPPGNNLSAPAFEDIDNMARLHSFAPPDTVQYSLGDSDYEPGERWGAMQSDVSPPNTAYEYELADQPADLYTEEDHGQYREDAVDADSQYSVDDAACSFSFDAREDEGEEEKEALGDLNALSNTDGVRSDELIFYEGRALLLGLSRAGEPVGDFGVAEEAGDRQLSSVQLAEADVVRRLRGHWRPQRL